MAKDNDATATYGSTASASTGTYGSKLSETYAYSDLREKEFKSKTHGIGVGDKIPLHELTYTVTGVISEGTGEAVIYKVEDDQRKSLALKLYFEFSNWKEEPNGETLKRIKEITDPDILKLHDFGVGTNKYLGKYCFEISDYAEGGDLFSVEDLKSKYSPEFIEKTIVTEIFKGIKKLHSYKIYHCDLKPLNIFFLDGNRTDIVIGDYGSAKAFDLGAEKDARKTSTVKGTEAYLSPEQGRGIISDKNDYYSLGMIVLHLLYPESIANDSNLRHVNKDKFECIVERQYSSMPIIDYDPKHQRLNSLIEGLTLVNHVNRWGRAEVERWLKGEEIEVKYKAFDTEPSQPIKLGYATIKTSKDFVNVLENNPAGYEDLIEDHDTYTTVKSWLDSYRDVPTRKVFDNIVRFYQPLGKEYVKEALLRFFEPGRPVTVDMHSYNLFTSTDIRKDVESFIGKLDEVWKITTLEQLRFYLFQLEFSLRQVNSSPNKQNPTAINALIEKLYSVFGLIQKPFDNFATEIPTKIDTKKETETFRQLLSLFYTFNSNRTFKDANNHSINTLEEVGLFLALDETAFTNKFLKAEKESFLEKIGKGKLNQLGYIPLIFEIFKDKAETEVEFLALSFDKQRNYKVLYKYYKSLSKFISKHGINKDLTSRSKKIEIYPSRRKFFGTFQSECEKFIATVCKKHNIETLTPENLADIRTKFRSDSWKWYLYIYCAGILTRFRVAFAPNLKPKTASLNSLVEKEPVIQKKLHWEPAFFVALASLFVTLPLLFLFAIFMGWIPTDKSSRYLTFTSAVNLDGINYSKDDFLKISSEEEFALCLLKGSNEQCYPTKSAVSIIKQGSNRPIDSIGTAHYEFNQARKVFKFTQATHILGHYFAVGSVADVTLDDGRQWCLRYGNKNSCYPRRTSGAVPDPIDNYGYVISNYQGKRLFTFNEDGTLNNVGYRKGDSWEVARDSTWATCLKYPRGEQCFLKATALNRFTKPNVPVAADYGKIGYKEVTVTLFGAWMAGLFTLLVAAMVFWWTTRIAKQLKLFFLHGEINTLRFKDL